jgi:hypothetical protein
MVAGLNEQEVVLNKKLLKLAQDIRGDLVHGRTPEKDIDIPLLRRICQRALAVILSLAAEFEDEDDLKVLLRDLPCSDSANKRIVQVQNRLYKMTP